MTNPEAVEVLVERAERDIRGAIWNGLRASGLNQEFAQIYIRAIMAEPLMSRALAALSSAPVAGAHVLDDSGLACSCHARFSTRWEAAEHAGLAHGGPLGALSHASPVDEGPWDRQVLAAATMAADAMPAEIAKRPLGASTPKDTGEGQDYIGGVWVPAPDEEGAG